MNKPSLVNKQVEASMCMYVMCSLPFGFVVYGLFKCGAFLLLWRGAFLVASSPLSICNTIDILHYQIVQFRCRTYAALSILYIHALHLGFIFSRDAANQLA